MERLREHLGIERWLLFGGSWGSTLILAYAERHPERVSEIVIPGVTTTRRSEIDWLYRGVGRFFPEAWERFRDGVPEAERDGDLVAAYARLMENPDPDVRAKAAADWCAWEDAVISMEPNGTPRVQRPAARRAAGLRPDLRALLRARRLAGGGRAAARRGPAGRHPGRAGPRPPRPAGPLVRQPAALHRQRLTRTAHPARHQPHARGGGHPPARRAEDVVASTSPFWGQHRAATADRRDARPVEGERTVLDRRPFAWPTWSARAGPGGQEAGDAR